MSMRDYPPTWIRRELWHELCDVWNSAAWRRRSESGSTNRNSMVDGCKSKHTGGSISMGQHRMKLAKENNGQQPTWDKVYCMTHLKASSKLRLVSGEESSGSQNLDFVTPKAQKVYETYHNAMKDKYGDDLTLHPLGDVELWEQCAGGRKKGRIFGVGISDPSFAVTGTPNCGMLAMDYARSQQEIRDLQTRIDESEARHQQELEQFRKEREESKARQETMEKHNPRNHPKRIFVENPWVNNSVENLWVNIRGKSVGNRAVEKMWEIFLWILRGSGKDRGEASGKDGQSISGGLLLGPPVITNQGGEESIDRRQRTGKLTDFGESDLSALYGIRYGIGEVVLRPYFSQITISLYVLILLRA
ncbi:unnamed protein product [Lactuca virosa]|uniref:Transposase, Ptta/En/Spm, plant n=1 Tax=Lactuca virosa TaxID=75947 RepID=A0AAU9PEW5_9ASTR|nr:unnamed protein product [Lactuca virosa]